MPVEGSMLGGKDFYRNFRWIINLLAQTEGEIKEYHLSPRIQGEVP